jgi:ADP-heptose:LPS heptosyltransferase
LIFNNLKLSWVTFSGWIQNLAIRCWAWILFSKTDHPRRVLVFRTGSIGDNICGIPAIVAIREHYRGAEILLMTDAGAQNMVGLGRLLSSEYYDGVIDTRMPAAQLRREIRSRKIDLVIELPQNIITLWVELRNMLFFRMAGIRSGFGWQVTTVYSFERTQERLLKFLSETANLLNILQRNGVAIPSSYKYPLELKPADHDTVNAILKEAGLTTEGTNRVAVVPGAKRQMNRYPFERFMELVSWLRTRGHDVVVVGGDEDIEKGKQLEEIDGVVSFCGRLTPIQSAVLLSHCKLTISNDTGPMHLSYAVGTPVIGLFSSRDFQEKWFPPKPNIALRNYDVHCSLCFSETCSNNICMQGIPLEEVKKSVVQLEAMLEGRP